MSAVFHSPFVGANTPGGGGVSAATALANVSELHHGDLLFSHSDPPPSFNNDQAEAHDDPGWACYSPCAPKK